MLNFLCFFVLFIAEDRLKINITPYKEILLFNLPR